MLKPMFMKGETPQTLLFYSTILLRCFFVSSFPPKLDILTLMNVNFTMTLRQRKLDNKSKRKKNPKS